MPHRLVLAFGLDASAHTHHISLASNSLLRFAPCTSYRHFWTQLEKYSVLRVYKKPANYGVHLSKLTMRMLPYSVLLHLMVTSWMLSDPTTLQSGLIDEQRDTRYVQRVALPR